MMSDLWFLLRSCHFPTSWPMHSLSCHAAAAGCRRSEETRHLNVCHQRLPIFLFYYQLIICWILMWLLFYDISILQLLRLSPICIGMIQHLQGPEFPRSKPQHQFQLRPQRLFPRSLLRHTLSFRKVLIPGVCEAISTMGLLISS